MSSGTGTLRFHCKRTSPKALFSILTLSFEAGPFPWEACLDLNVPP